MCHRLLRLFVFVVGLCLGQSWSVTCGLFLNLVAHLPKDASPPFPITQVDRGTSKKRKCEKHSSFPSRERVQIWDSSCRSEPKLTESIPAEPWHSIHLQENHLLTLCPALVWDMHSYPVMCKASALQAQDVVLRGFICERFYVIMLPSPLPCRRLHLRLSERFRHDPSAGSSPVGLSDWAALCRAEQDGILSLQPGAPSIGIALDATDRAITNLCRQAAAARAAAWRAIPAVVFGGVAGCCPCAQKVVGAPYVHSLRHAA